MIKIEFGIRRDNLELLNSIINEAADYPVWTIFYGIDTLASLQNTKNTINELYKHSIEDEKDLYELSLSFKEGQVLKKAVIFYLNDNFSRMESEGFEKVSDFLLFVDDALEFELSEMQI
jgi:hypothetical protein